MTPCLYSKQFAKGSVDPMQASYRAEGSIDWRAASRNDPLSALDRLCGYPDVTIAYDRKRTDTSINTESTWLTGLNCLLADWRSKAIYGQADWAARIDVVYCDPYKSARSPHVKSSTQAPSGIDGFDEMTGSGLPRSGWANQRPARYYSHCNVGWMARRIARSGAFLSHLRKPPDVSCPQLEVSTLCRR